jgi:hypothetical protein
VENKALLDQGKIVPKHMELPPLEDILKLRQSPRNNNNNTFTFFVEYMAGAVIGQRKWKTTRCYARLNKHMTMLDEAFMLLVVENQYKLWINFDSNKVGRRKYTKNGPNRKFCGWTKKRMRQSNELLKDIRGNQNKQYSDEVEDMTLKALAERHRAFMRGSRKNSCKRHCHSMEFSADLSDKEDDDDASVIPKDDLGLLATQLTMV